MFKKFIQNFIKTINHKPAKIRDKYSHIIYLSNNKKTNIKTSNTKKHFKNSFKKTLPWWPITWWILEVLVCLWITNSLIINESSTQYKVPHIYIIKLRLFFHGIYFLLFFQKFLHSTLCHFLYYSIFIKYWMTLITCLNFDRSRNCRVYCKFCSTYTLNSYILVILRMYSFFHF